MEGTVQKQSRKTSMDWVLVFVVVVLVLFGFLMVYSSSFPDGYYKFDKDPFYFLKKQVIAAVAGFVGMIFIANIPYKIYAKFNKIILIACVGFALLTIIIGIASNGAQRWIIIGGISLQPSEIIKIGGVLYMAYYFDKNRKNISSLKKGFFPSMILIGFFCLLIAIQDDLSTAVILGGTLMVMFFCAGAKMAHLVVLFLLAVAGVIVLISMETYRITRIIVFFDPFKYPLNEGYQIIQSLYALGTGGLFGMGIGKSRQKFFHLPEAYNDFIFSIIGEELGFIGCVFVILGFVIFAWRGLRISMNTDDFFGSQVALGITTLVLLQFLIHVAVATSSMPPTGRALPFISAGGSSLMFLLLSMGILLNISKYSNTYRS
ncbi:MULTISPECIES: putative lipid II flippase FtsW [Sedimentibacter]|uniref:Probable peptidoglycan glycosyltransferase FtsW n=1 Tax=Sedimentibacter hydroxybenzoicus DSM 7310 TaxID=1123245 RepID=A0A974BJI7_SEDHY|nr:MULTISPECIES: putative lipid II flippase FtsW [Sedimentibacter]NYB73922.1 putative lipid II flippase FtsW [Sedimentibacter hydroxybenzoicus DSM 7310]HCX61441.1 putative lipid II flippase FtsW [Clostridiales bacterium]